MQFVFNAFSKYKVPFDKWSIMDFLNAILNSTIIMYF